MEQHSRHDFLWSLPQPLYVFGCTILTASAFTYQWIRADLLVSGKEWLLNWRDVRIDAFWVFTLAFIWFPIFSEYYETPVSSVFKALRDASNFPFKLQAYSVIGLVVMAMIGIFASEFIGYWAHRLQHRFMLLWRIHATHHHITKMSAARSDRTHPLEIISLQLGTATALAYLGASGAVIAVALVFRVTTAYINHSNLPLTSGVFGWLFNTNEYHQLHHSCNYAQSNSNYGCTVIIWDRIFGTFSAYQPIEKAGNGTGRELSLIEQITIPFRSNSTLRKL